MKDIASGVSPVRVATVNPYLARKQCLVPAAQGADVVGVTRDVVALHATAATGPYLSLWARLQPLGASDFHREMLEYALYDSRELVRIPCMRNTVHVVLSDEVHRFLAAYGPHHLPPEFRDWDDLFVQAGLCREHEAGELLRQLTHQVLALVKEEGPLTVQEITRKVPELSAKVHYSEGKVYAGAFSLGSRFVAFLCVGGLLVRARPRGTWRSNLYEYAAIGEWLHGFARDTICPEAAEAWLIERYLGAFGPASLEDVQWWTGFSADETLRALASLGSRVEMVAIEGLGDDYLMLAEDALQLAACVPPEHPYVFLLPALDPYIMGYRDRRRFLAAEHNRMVFDRAGNALPTVWVGGRVVGAWTQREDGSVAHGLFEEVDGDAWTVLDEQCQRLQEYFAGEYVPQRTHSPFTRSLHG